LPADEVIGQAGRCLKRPDRNSAMLSVKVFQEGEYFGWTLNAPSNEVLGHGTAETEQKAAMGGDTPAVGLDGPAGAHRRPLAPYRPPLAAK